MPTLPPLPAPSCQRSAPVELPVHILALDLTRAQIDIALLLAWGASNKEAAMLLEIAPATVKNHVAAILGKAATPTRARFAAFFHTGQNVQPPLPGSTRSELSDNVAVL